MNKKREEEKVSEKQDSKKIIASEQKLNIKDSKRLDKKDTNSKKTKDISKDKLKDKSKDKSQLEGLLDSIDPKKQDSDKLGDLNDFNLVSKVIDYSALIKRFNLEQLNYAGADMEYLPKASSEHDAKYKEWEKENEYLMEDSSTMDEVEAKDTVREAMSKSIFGGGEELSLEKKRRLDNWIKFNPTLFALYQSTSALRSDDVNYGT